MNFDSASPLSGDSGTVLPPSCRVPLFDLVGGLSAALDLISPAVVNHHLRTGLVAARLARHMGLPGEDVADLILASLLHDIGAFSLETRLDTLAFETESLAHSAIGATLLCGFAPFAEVADIVRWHHHRHEEAPRIRATDRVLRLAGLIHVADRIDVLLRGAGPSCPNPQEMRAILGRSAGLRFEPRTVRAAGELLCGTPLTADVEAPAAELLAELRPLAAPRDRIMGEGELVAFSGLFAQVIDFRSRFTATHSRGVAVTARDLALLAGMAPGEANLLFVSGNLHDVGKLGVPTRLLDKSTPLSTEEFDAIRRHADYGAAILGAIPGLDRAGRWASQHHERLDGGGYPSRLSEGELDTGARILAVADVFTALAEDRPYRAGMTREEAAAVLGTLARNHSLDAEVVSLLLDHYEQADATRVLAQSEALADFRSLARRSAV